LMKRLNRVLQPLYTAGLFRSMSYRLFLSSHFSLYFAPPRRSHRLPWRFPFPHPVHKGHPGRTFWFLLGGLVFPVGFFLGLFFFLVCPVARVASPASTQLIFFFVPNLAQGNHTSSFLPPDSYQVFVPGIIRQNIQVATCKCSPLSTPFFPFHRYGSISSYPSSSVVIHENAFGSSCFRPPPLKAISCPPPHSGEPFSFYFAVLT